MRIYKDKTANDYFHFFLATKPYPQIPSPVTPYLPHYPTPTSSSLHRLSLDTTQSHMQLPSLPPQIPHPFFPAYPGSPHPICHLPKQKKEKGTTSETLWHGPHRPASCTNNALTSLTQGLGKTRQVRQANQW
ncbi:hypothetical protein P167DRAFT_142264 [Morchella conica CCBAS932]|uniref:Uncharacterized protein n=1 Tax=Morchella conica CCBAS932 TaxID=1392247 RepID=A0A3N4KR38_9PEZI|nr:hypothetical protein P167DRAFT_142264 [Morchella conica CCBAS932]